MINATKNYYDICLVWSIKCVEKIDPRFKNTKLLRFNPVSFFFVLVMSFKLLLPLLSYKCERKKGTIFERINPEKASSL